MTCLASFGPRVCFFFFFHVLLIFLVYLGSIHTIKRRGRLGWPATTITGPNDVSCIVWTKGMCFFILFRVLLILTNGFYFI